MRLLLLIFPVLFLSSNLYPQSVNRAIRKAEHSHFKGNEDEAQKIFSKVVRENPNSAKASYWYGRYIIENRFSTHKDSAYIYIEKAQSLLNGKKPTSLDKHFYLYLGKAYQYAYKFDKAIEAYNQVLQEKHRLYPHVKQEAELGKAQCEVAKDLKTRSDTNKYDIFNLGDKVNSYGADYVPIPVPGGTTLIFTSRKPGNLGKRRGEENEFSEDVHIAERRSAAIPYEWKDESYRVEMPKINRSNHEAVVSISHDGKKIYFYHDREDGNQGNLYEADVIIEPNGKVSWSELRPLKEINTKSREPSLCVTPDNNVIFFSSDREGTKGGLDLWYIKKENGKWSTPVNCEKLNTEYDEDAPYVTYDGKYLYFSARGKRSIGGFDIFKVSFDVSTMTFGEVQNVGFPLNSVGDDIYIFTEVGDTSGYFTSSRDRGIGEKDNYYFQPKRLKPKKEEQIAKVYEQFGSLRGVVIDEDTGDPIANSTVKIEGTPFMATTDKEGRYEILDIPPGNYQVSYHSEGYQGKKIDILMPEGQDVFMKNEMPFDVRMKINDDVVANMALKRLQQGQSLVDVAANLRTEADKVRDILMRKYPQMFKDNTNNFDISLASISKQDLEYIQRVYFNFHFDKTIVVRGLQVKLDSIVQIMNKYPNLKLLVYGHCDTIGTHEYNMDLGMRRANRIINYLKEKGISENRMTPISFGFTKPIKSNKTQAGRDANRRVDFGYDNGTLKRTLTIVRPLTDAINKTLDSLALRMKVFTNSTIEIKVHLEKNPNYPSNQIMEMSQKRAQALKDILIQKGIESSRINSYGLGDTQPIDTSNTPSSNYKNRRVEFILTNLIEEKGVRY
ncbi:MAG: OmpA family protein [Bacteroidia bacterium]|nr:OmpA family protein [Bacteroidia bacterium]MDW8348161.1 OmpA family protein [Bacteroidia bacterium]